MICEFHLNKEKMWLTHRNDFWHMGHIRLFFFLPFIFIRHSDHYSMGGNGGAVCDAQANRSQGGTQSLPFVVLGREPPKHVLPLSFLDHVID